MNRIQTAINKMNDKLTNITNEQLTTLKNSFNNVDDFELIEFQKTQSLAFASNLLSLEEAHLVYNILGRKYPSIEKFHKRSLAEKIVITILMKELFEKLHKL